MKGGTTPLFAVEDWSGAGFHIKQPLNVGQPTVSQVVSSPDNQSCHGGAPHAGPTTPCQHRGGGGTAVPAPTVQAVLPSHTRATAPFPGIGCADLWAGRPRRVLHNPAEGHSTGRSGKQASKRNILLSWYRGDWWRHPSHTVQAEGQ